MELTEPVQDLETLQSLDRVRVYFTDPLITFGPIWGDYFVWDHACKLWARLSPEQAAKALPPVSESRLLDFYNLPWPRSVIPLPSDGLIAKRAVWVRPDATVLELVRRNDAPLHFLMLLGYTLASPAMCVIQPQYSCGVCILTISGWHAFLVELRVDSEELDEEWKTLREEIRNKKKKLESRQTE